MNSKHINIDMKDVILEGLSVGKYTGGALGGEWLYIVRLLGSF